MDKLTALNIFKRVVELNSFAAAAKDMDYSNAAISKNIQELEAELGTRLLLRNTRHMNLTEAGQNYYQQIVRLLDELDAADQQVSEMSQLPRGNLKINAPMSLGISILSPAIHQFLKQYPDITIDLQLNDQRIDLMEEGFDLSIRASSRLSDSSLIQKKLADLERSICASPKYIKNNPINNKIESLSEHNCLIYKLAETPNTWKLYKKKSNKQIKVNGALTINNSLSIREAALTGLGIALLPKYLIQDHIKAGRLKTLFEDWHPEQQAIYALFPKHREHSQVLRVFIDFLIDTFNKDIS